MLRRNMRGHNNKHPSSNSKVSQLKNGGNNNNNNEGTITLPRNKDVTGVQDTIYLCNFRVSVDGEWLCLKELQDGVQNQNEGAAIDDKSIVASTDKCNEKIVERDWVNYYSRDPASIERSNLVNICKLVVKELLEQSLRYGRQLDSDHLPLQHFFIILEHILRHGLKPKKGLLGPKKELWDLLQSAEKYCPEAQDVTMSIRDLPTVRTHTGRSRAWLRLALMQKKLADYLQALIEHKNEILVEYYEPHALMLSDEIVVIMGILVGLNVIDCNLCVKGEDLDSQQGVIDFSLYLRSSSRSSPEEDQPAIEGGGNMTAVLDQKNYIEELNRHLNATVANLQQKAEQLTTTNALMKEDLAIARNSLLTLQAENAALRQNQNASQQIVDRANVLDRIDPEMAEALADEKKRRQELERELELQVCLKAETEMAMKLLEKDIHEKQDTIISLRRQLEDIKQINLEMYKKLQECESSLKHKTDLLTKLESQRESMSSAILQLEKKHSSDLASFKSLEDTTKTLTSQIVTCEEARSRCEADLRIEREWRSALQSKEVEYKEAIAKLQSKINEHAEELKKSEKTKAELERLRRKYNEDQQTLEELGVQLSMTKLQVSELKERSKIAEELGNGRVMAMDWTPDQEVSNCNCCKTAFSITKRKHHCRSCGEVVCKSCSDHLLPLEDATGALGKPVRVCDTCWQNRVN